MAHYSINNIIQEVASNPKEAQSLGEGLKNTSRIQTTPERKLPIFITKQQLADKYDTIIVGAGVAGLYAAYKIAKVKTEEKILIVEQSKRTGGRLDTDLFSINENLIKEEEGGMRFTFEDMPQLMNLFVELGLDKHIVPFPMHLDDNNRRSFRGRTFSAKESGRNNFKVWSDLYGLKNEEKGINPSSIIPDLVYPRIINDPDNANAKETLDKLNFEHEKYLRGEEFESSITVENVKIEVSAAGIWQFFRLTFIWKGIELYKWTLWSMLADMGYSKECIEMMARVSGFNGCYFSTMNAGEAFQLLMEFPAEPDFKSMRYGFSQLTNALVDKLVEAGNVKIILETKVSKVENNYSITIVRESQNKDVNFDNLFLALPRVALEKLVNASNLQVSNENHLWNNLESTTNQPLAKINLYYDKAWWNSDLTPNADVTFGPNFTDMPLGSVYPFYSDNEEVTNAAAKLQELKVQISKQENGPTEVQKGELLKLEGDLKAKMKKLYAKPAALTVYCDYQNINFWQGFAKTLTETNTYPQNNEKVKQIKVLKDYLEKPKDENNFINLTEEYITPASNEMVSAITDYFQQLFQTNKVPKPIATSVRIWEGSQSLKTDAYGNFGYGVHQWGVGAKDDEVISQMVKPFGDLPIYTCGEAYSDFQGWVEGALRSTNHVLDAMKISKGFIPENYPDRVTAKEKEAGKDVVTNSDVLNHMRKNYAKKYKV